MFAKVPASRLAFGRLFAVGNRIQSVGDRFFDGITTKQHFFLMALNLFPQPPSLTELAELIGCSYQNVKKTALALEKKGFLDIRQDAEDKRRYRLVKTGKIRQVSTDIDGEIREFFNRLFRGVAAEEIAAFQSVLERMDENLKEMRGQWT